ncbi:MAG: sigma-70 family RNA polymerase sigma factor [Dehalococcoidia bacterium]|nr:sigma-70 family RNA polymerase sigma factor [Dehalococcoidia bacterium]
MEQLADSSLIELAQGGDQHAFAELYSRYFDPVYDFVARMMRNRDEAADVAQDSFLKAMNALGGLQKGTSFKSWIFTIARNTALNRIEKNSRTRPLTFEGEDGEEVGFDVVDTDRFSDPEEAAQASAVASLVWEASAGLDPKQLSLLDLHLRQGLDSGEIADVMGVTKNNGYVMLNRLKKAVEESIGAFVMFKDGRQYCGELDSVLKKADIQGMSPETRKVVERHVALCPGCEERKKKLAPLAAFAAFGAIGAPAGAKAHILEGLMQQWPGSLAPAGAGGGTSRPNDRLRPADPPTAGRQTPGSEEGRSSSFRRLRRAPPSSSPFSSSRKARSALLKDDHGSQQALFVPSETRDSPLRALLPARSHPRPRVRYGDAVLCHAIPHGHGRRPGHHSPHRHADPDEHSRPHPGSRHSDLHALAIGDTHNRPHRHANGHRLRAASRSRCHLGLRRPGWYGFLPGGERNALLRDILGHEDGLRSRLADGLRRRHNRAERFGFGHRLGEQRPGPGPAGQLHRERPRRLGQQLLHRDGDHRAHRHRAGDQQRHGYVWDRHQFLERHRQRRWFCRFSRSALQRQRWDAANRLHGQCRRQRLARHHRQQWKERHRLPRHRHRQRRPPGDTLVHSPDHPASS